MVRIIYEGVKINVLIVVVAYYTILMMHEDIYIYIHIYLSKTKINSLIVLIIPSLLISTLL